MIILSLLLFTTILTLIAYGKNLNNRYKTQLVLQAKMQRSELILEITTLQQQCTDYQKNEGLNNRLKLQMRALFKRIDTLENERDSLQACLAALETEDNSELCEMLEEECKNLAKKVVTLHKNNTEILIKLESYKDYERKQKRAQPVTIPIKRMNKAAL